MTFDITQFRAEFTRRIAQVTASLGELDLVAAELRRRVTGFAQTSF